MHWLAHMYPSFLQIPTYNSNGCGIYRTLTNYVGQMNNVLLNLRVNLELLESLINTCPKISPWANTQRGLNAEEGA